MTGVSPNLPDATLGNEPQATVRQCPTFAMDAGDLDKEEEQLFENTLDDISNIIDDSKKVSFSDDVEICGLCSQQSGIDVYQGRLGPSCDFKNLKSQSDEMGVRSRMHETMHTLHETMHTSHGRPAGASSSTTITTTMSTRPQ